MADKKAPRRRMAMGMNGVRLRRVIGGWGVNDPGAGGRGLFHRDSSGWRWTDTQAHGQARLSGSHFTTLREALIDFAWRPRA